MSVVYTISSIPEVSLNSTCIREAYFVKKFIQGKFHEDTLVYNIGGKWYSDDIGFELTENFVSSRNIRLVKFHQKDKEPSNSVYWFEGNTINQLKV